MEETEADSKEAPTAVDSTEALTEVDFNEALALANSCTEDSECVVIHPDCPLRCFVAVRRDHEAQMQRLADAVVAAYRSRGEVCAHACAPNAPPECLSGRCVVEGQAF